MAISNPTLLDTQTLETADKLNSASISPSANALLVIVHTVLAGSGWTDAVSDSFGANLGDWTSIGVEIDGASTVHMWIHYAQCSGTPGSGTVTVYDMTMDPPWVTRQVMFVLELTGHNTTSPVVQYKVYSSDATPTSPEITLDSSPAAGSLVLGAIGGGVGTTSSAATSGSGFTELADTRVGTTGVTSCAVQYDNGGADTTCDWSLSNYGQTITGIALEIAAGPVSITLDKAAVTASGKALSITKGAVSITLAKAALTAAGKALSVTAPIPPPSITLAKAALTASGKALTVTPGAVSITLAKAALTAAGKALSVTAPIPPTSITLAKAALIASGKVLTVTPGAVSITLDKAALVASGKSLMVTPGAVSVTLDKAGLTAAGKSLTVMPGAVSVTLDKAALIAAGKKVTVTATAAITVTLGKATITASGKSLTVTPGAVSISLDKAAILTAGKSIAVSAPAPDTGGHSAWAYNRWKEMELREYLESEDEIVILLASAEVIRRGRG